MSLGLHTWSRSEFIRLCVIILRGHLTRLLRIFLFPLGFRLFVCRLLFGILADWHAHRLHHLEPPTWLGQLGTVRNES